MHLGFVGAVPRADGDGRTPGACPRFPPPVARAGDDRRGRRRGAGGAPRRRGPPALHRSLPQGDPGFCSRSPSMSRKAVVAMSGGVDSSVAAALMKDAGWDVTGIMLKLWSGPAANNESGCCSLDAAEDARRVAQVLDIPFYVFNFAEEFARTVVDDFVSAYARGRTPNPCVTCNRAIKFSALAGRARAVGAEALATGHYARVDTVAGQRRLLRACDRAKDQSYVLYMLNQAELSWTHFPVGEYSKPEIREIAASLGLRTAHKPESQEICFVPGGRLHPFLEQAVPEGSRPGPILDGKGSRIGTHRGFAHYTVGQRRGLGVGVGLPLYVREVRPADNALVVAPAE